MSSLIRLSLCSLIWRLSDWQFTAAGRVLLRALGSKDENTRTIAGMLLVRAGRRAEPLLGIELDKRKPAAPVAAIIEVLGSIEDGYEVTLAKIERFLSAEEAEVRSAAEQALKLRALSQERKARTS